MAILVRCTGCDGQFRAEQEMAGKRMSCTHCSAVLLVEGDRIRDHDVFISHSSKDVVLAELVREELVRRHRRCWISTRDIPSGGDWPKTIVEGIEGSGALLLIFSAHANSSRQVMREVERAADKGIPIIPFRIEDIPPSKNLEYFLAGSQWHNALTEPIVEHIERLMPALRQLLGDDENVNRPPSAERAARPMRPNSDSVTSKHGASVPPTVQAADPSGLGADAAIPVNVPDFHFGGIVPPDFFVGRAEELRQAERAVRSGNNLLLVGELRAGKTSLGKMLMHRVASQGNRDILGVYLNVQSWPTMGIEPYLENTALALLCEISRKVFQLRFPLPSGSDPLRDRADLRDDPAFAAYWEVHRFFKDRIAEKNSDTPPAFRVEEFLQVQQDLMEILRAKGWKRCFVFYDEANQLGDKQSIELLLSHQEGLTLAGLTAIYSVSPEMVTSQPKLCDWFAHHVHLGPLCGQEEMCQLLARYYFQDASRWQEVPMTDEAREGLWQLSQGKPFLIQLIAGRSFDLANRDGKSQLSMNYITDAHAQIKREKPTAFHNSRA